MREPSPGGLWTEIEPLVLARPPRPKGGRPWADDRDRLRGIVLVPRGGMPRRICCRPRRSASAAPPVGGASGDGPKRGPGRKSTAECPPTRAARHCWRTPPGRTCGTNGPCCRRCRKPPGGSGPARQAQGPGGRARGGYGLGGIIAAMVAAGITRIDCDGSQEGCETASWPSSGGSRRIDSNTSR